MADWRTLGLGDGGRSLVEASAGTGKTWTIAALYLRLLLERGLGPRRIVVATYTNAAAAELRQRLRGRIEGALVLARSGTGAGDDAECWLHERWTQDPASQAGDVARLSLALAELDLAPIDTLHGLCMRILAEHPFAAGAAFQAPTLVDSSGLRRELADDLWRLLHGQGEPGGALRALAEPLRGTLKRDVLREQLASLLQPKVVVPEPVDAPPPECAEWAERLHAIVARVEVFTRSNDALRSRWNELAQFLDSWRTTPDFDLLGKLDKVAGCLDEFEQGGKHIRTACRDDEDVLGVAVVTRRILPVLQQAIAAPWARFHAAVQAWAKARLAHRLASAGQLGFDELLTTVEAALQPAGDGTRALADALFASWPVALIDEFQDTDPVQYGILDAVYSDGEGNPRGRLVLIGDPKQAIYRFRGGDIHTYQRARDVVPAGDCMSLDVNRRSSTRYVQALNAFYAQVGATLGGEASDTDIAFVEAKPRDGADGTRFSTPDAGDASGLVLHASAHDGGDEQAGDAGDGTTRTTGAGDDEFAALKSCADTIAMMLHPDAGHRIGDRALRPSDICVLLPNNWQVRRVVDLLRERGVPSVNRGRGSVFESDTARDLLLVLDAVAHCGQPRRLRAAAATRLWGLGYHDLRALREDAEAWRELAGQFHRWHRAWERQGVLAVVCGLLQEVARKQLGSREGERTLTDLRHLGELLQDRGDGTGGMESVLAWFRTQIEADDAADEDDVEARALRMESDAHCVQVLTLHTSKGLEFPLVFLPLMWKHTSKRQQKRLQLLAQDDGTRRVVLDDAGKRAVALEEQDERFRVLYVALTRAGYACHVWLPGAATDNDAPLTLLRKKLQPWLADPQQVPEGIRIGQGWPGSPGIRLPGTATDATPRAAKPMPPPLHGPLPARHSFSTLVRAARHFEDNPWAPAGDEADSAGPMATPATLRARTSHPELAALQGVAGADFGNAVHAVLELRKVGLPLTGQVALVRDALARYAVRHRELPDDALAERLAARLQGVLAADLDGHGLRLCELPECDLRAEMEFNYALDGASLARLRDACADAGHPGLLPVRAQPLAGLMNGKIDLVFRHDGRFHVLDWKGNLLGDALEDYASESLEAKMDAERYRFQALLYAVAVERYLKSRLPGYSRERHLGDCWYLFVRATGLRLPDGRACGVWRHRFDDALLDAVQAELATLRRGAA